jgi:hypothetical protein
MRTSGVKRRLVYETHPMSPISKIEKRRRAGRQAARNYLEAVVTGKADAYEGYRKLWGLWCRNNAALQELRPLFRIPDVEPEGVFIVTPEFREQVMLLARAILPKFED